MLYLFGIFIAFVSLMASILHLNQSALSYFDFVGFAMVIGGTSATAVITFPWDIRGEIFFRVKELFTRPMPKNKELLDECMRVNQSVAKGNYAVPIQGRGLHKQILRDGLELIQLGLGVDKIELILKERLYHAVGRSKQVGSAMRSLAKYPPAFGLAGTVLGLVHLMRGVSEGMAPQETGIRMAIALIATFYGLLVANLIVNPAGEAISRNAHEEEKLGEIALQSILLAAERVNLLEAQEMLNSYVEAKDRVDIVELGLSGLEDADNIVEARPQEAAS